ncbi:helix-turn-helix domain-containing protein [Mycobacterium paraense]|uniref:helix-turn-helix domain-containing protein n=1 Tax=Mycobacterium paraense TaxID=767916 RepID=UPI00148369E7|nr:AraC family transcriptional regulator [Mycobacterium paraense]
MPERPIRVLNERHLSASVVPVHRHLDRVQLICAVRGLLRIKAAKLIWLVGPGSGVIIPASCEHEIHVPGNAILRAVNISPSRLTNIHSCFVVQLGRLIDSLLHEVALLPADHQLGGTESRLVDVLLDQIASAPAQAFGLRQPEDPRARRIVDALLEDASDRRTLEAWGREVGASRRTLSRIFESETGMSFRDYRRNAHLQISIGLLAEGFSVAQVADKLGYETVSAFIYAFRTVTGLAPGKYTQLSTGGARPSRSK